MLRRKLLPATIGAFAMPGIAWAQGRAVRLVVPYSAGRGSDVQAQSPCSGSR